MIVIIYFVESVPLQPMNAAKIAHKKERPDIGTFFFTYMEKKIQTVPPTVTTAIKKLNAIEMV
jgi:hypothetical protein